MSFQKFYTVDLYINFPVVLKSCFILNCSDDIIKFFCDCIFNVIRGNVKLDEAAQSKDFLALVVAGRHRNVHLMVLRHNLFQRTKNSKTIDLNVTQIVLFNSPGDSDQIGVLGRQLGERHATMEAYKRATQKSFGHLMIGLDVRSSKSLWYSSNCSGDVPSIFYCSTDQLGLHLDNEFTKLSYN